MVCLCHFVAEPKILQVLKKYPNAELEDIKKLTYAGTGCGRCIPVLNKIIDDYRKNNPESQQRLF